MRITVTFGEIMDAGLWEEFCELKGIDVYCVAHGLAETDTERSVSKLEAQVLGLIPQDPLF